MTYRDSEIITASKLGYLSRISKAGTHDNGLVPVFLVIVEYVLYALNAGVILGSVVLFHRSLVPIKNATNERRYEKGSSFCPSDCLWERKHEGQVTVDPVFRLEGMCSLDALPCGGKLDQNSGFVNADGFVQLILVSIVRAEALSDCVHR